MKTVIKNISKIVQVEETPKRLVCGEEMSKIHTIDNAFIEISKGIIKDFGSMDQWKGIEDWNNTKVIDAEEGMVFPSYCDSHTHLVFSEYREQEFIDRINGLSYEEIAQKGGGILNSAKKLQRTSEEDLFKISKKRLRNLTHTGTGAIEIKSGYGLTVKDEIKILNVIKRLKETSEVTIKSTFLGAHAVPIEYKKNKEKYIDLIINEMLPEIHNQKLADYVDVFCENGYFSVKDTIKIIEASRKYDLLPKIHVNQFNALGGIKEFVTRGALSLDHLEIMNKEDFKALSETSCMPTLLPGCSFFLGIPYAPAKEIIRHGLPIALSSDYNPGSSPSGNMQFISSLGCIKMKLNPEEVINATTINSAYAMGVEKEVGSICKEKKANLFITKKIPSYNYLPYSFGENIIKKIILNGKIIA